jgi:hypothetical protein
MSSKTVRAFYSSSLFVYTLRVRTALQTFRRNKSKFRVCQYQLVYIYQKLVLVEMYSSVILCIIQGFIFVSVYTVRGTDIPYVFFFFSYMFRPDGAIFRWLWGLMYLWALFATCLHVGLLLNLCFRPWRWKVTCSSETSVDNQRTTRCYIPEDGTLHWNWLVSIHCMPVSGTLHHQLAWFLLY